MSRIIEAVRVLAWELYTGPPEVPGRDAFYRVLVVGHNVFLHYGATGGRGQFNSYHCGDAEEARQKALARTDAKAGNGYRLSRDLTVFDVAADLLPNKPQARERPPSYDTLVDRFVEESDRQGTVISQ